MAGQEGALPTEEIRVLIADDHALFRKGLEMVLHEEPDIQVVAEASDAEEAVQRTLATMPDVVLMDVRMPKGGGIEAARRIKEMTPHVKVVMLTVSDEDRDLFESVKAGAVGYLLKEASIEEVPEAIRAAYRGQSLISPSMAARLLDEFKSISRRSGLRGYPAPRLTDREMEILRLVADGKSNKEIARELYISENTVKNHVRNILEKLHLHSRMEAVLYALREKLIELK